MARRISHHGLDAIRARHNGRLVWLIRARQSDLGIACQESRRLWLFYRDFAAMARDGVYYQSDKLESIMAMIAQDQADMERIVRFNPRMKTMPEFTFQQVIREIDTLAEACREGSLEDKEAVCEAIADFTVDYPMAETYAGKKLVEMFLPEFKAEPFADLQIELAA